MRVIKDYEYLSENERHKMETQAQEARTQKGNGKGPALAIDRAPDAKPTTLAAKLAAIIGEVGRVAKNGYNQHFKYAYVTESDLTDVVRPLLSKHGIGVSFSVEEAVDLANNITQVKIRYALVNGEDSADRLEMTCFGRGQDKADKGIYKAITGATKYWLYKTFLVSTGDDPENEDESGNRQNQQQGSMVTATGSRHQVRLRQATSNQMRKSLRKDEPITPVTKRTRRPCGPLRGQINSRSSWMRTRLK